VKHDALGAARLGVLLLLASCPGRWSKRQTDDFRARCEQTRTLSGLVIQLTGFEREEIENVEVKELVDGGVTDTFVVHVHDDGRDAVRKSYTASIDRVINVGSAYEFDVRSQQPYRLEQMRMVIWPQFSMTSEGWGCVMGDYVLDGRHFVNSANPSIVKRAPGG